jgi:2-oxoglutarate dehydrogenase E1 component
MTVEILANPSHLECINPVVMGKVRAEQYYSHDEARRNTTIPILIHGDAAFAG